MFEEKVIFIGGKGGVGKSTISSALALKYASKNKPSLLISTDPAHNLCDIFDFKSSSKIKNIYEGLDILEIDAKKEVKSYMDELASNTKRFIKSSSYELMDEYYKQLSKSQNALSSALFERLVHSVVELIDKYGKIIIDTAPTGHTLKFFDTPKELSKYLELLLAKATSTHNLYEDNKENKSRENLALMSASLKKRTKLYQDFEKIIKNPKLCDVSLVCIPTKLSVNESKRAFDFLKAANMPLKHIFINMLFPPSKEAFLQAHNKTQKNYVEEIEAFFKEQEIIKIFLQEEELLGVQSLKALF